MKKNQIDNLVDENDYNHTKKNNNLPRKSNKKHKFRLKFAAILAAIGLTGLATAISGAKDKTLPKANIIEEEIGNHETGENSNREEFINSLSYDTSISKEEEEVNSLETKEDVLKFLKNEYIEKYEQMTGDKDLTTDDIKIIASYQNYLYSNEEEIVTHGANPDQLRNQLEQYGNYSVINDCEVFQVKDQDDKTIDAATYINGNLEYVVPGDNYEEMKNNNSVLVELGDVIPKGLQYYENVENGKDDASYAMTKRSFINALEENQKEQANNVEIENDDIERS